MVVTLAFVGSSLPQMALGAGIGLGHGSSGTTSGGTTGGGTTGGGGGGGTATSPCSSGTLDAKTVRCLAKAAGLASLATVTAPPHFGEDQFVKSTAMLKKLGKALFWDMQVGSDGQACASCHFAAGADSRTKNQLDPGVKAGDSIFGNSGVPGTNGAPNFKPNYTLTPADFPTHRGGSDTNDVVSSQGVFAATFTKVNPGSASFNDTGTPIADDNGFTVGGVNVRRVEPRNTPTIINAGFAFVNFWDGRAHSCFNGQNPVGPLAEQGCNTGSAGPAGSFTQIFANTPSSSTASSSHVGLGTTTSSSGSGTLTPVAVSVANSSLASQATGPVLSPFEMSFRGRQFPDVGRKLLGSTPLAFQQVSSDDSVLGALANPATGLNMSYPDLIKAAFNDIYWNNTSSTVGGYNQMEINFPLYFGLAVQEYMASQVSDQSPFDRFMGDGVTGDDNALTADQLKGLATFINTPATSGTAAFKGVAQGNCVSCHAGPEFTEGAFTTLSKSTAGTGAGNGQGQFLTEIVPTVGADGNLSTATAFRDRGFANIGVRPTAEDPGRGENNQANGHPVSFVRQALKGDTVNGHLVAPEPLPTCGTAGRPACPINGRDIMQGAFKIPSLRNVELTGPYFNNGGEATLKQVLDFYQRGGDFKDTNAANLDPRMLDVKFGGGDGDSIVNFLTSLTDPRVRNQGDIFDHPQIMVPNGQPGDTTSATVCSTVGGVSVACDDRLTVPATGKSTVSPLGTFLGLSPFQN